VKGGQNRVVSMKHEGSVKVEERVLSNPSPHKLCAGFDWECGPCSKLRDTCFKTVVMDVIGFLCVSLGSSTVHLHDRLRSKRACACL
jgi:hypothetical protein